MNIAILLAAGKSKRFDSDKLFALFNDEPLILSSLRLLERHAAVDEIFIAANSGNERKIKALIKKENFKKVKDIVMGGTSRFKSILKVISLVQHKKSPQFFIIHNAANPFATSDEITRCLHRLRVLKSGVSGVAVSGVAVGREINSTLKKAPAGFVAHTVDRENLWETETPQVVRAKEFIEACREFHNRDFTDDLEVLEAAGRKTAIINAAPQNRKITARGDLDFFHSAEFAAVGIGEDSHKFRSSGKNLILGGLKIKGHPALLAESDGDVILHALCNAVASALGKSSLGTYATKMAQRGIKNSQRYLEKILIGMERQHRAVHHCAISIEAARPMIDPLTPKIKKNLSRLLKIPIARIGITATSGEKLTPFGKGKAIRCQAIVLLRNC